MSFLNKLFVYILCNCQLVLLITFSVSRYQSDDAKKFIMRLEQGVHSYMQRTLANHGAFAVLYGRQSKHYIRKSEVCQLNKALPLFILE